LSLNIKRRKMRGKMDIVISKYLLGIADNKEILHLKDWLEKSESNKKYFGESENIWNAIEIIKNKDDVKPEDAWEKIEKRMMSNNTDFSRKGEIKAHPAIHLILRVAAIIIFTIGFSWSGFYIYYKKVLSVSDAYNEIVVPRGSKSIINLPDGTKIWLNAETTLKYPERFGGKCREVILDGEAFFDVAKDENRAFTVKTSDLDITALGTSFNVKSYSNEGSIETTLVTGSLCIHKRGVKDETKKVILKPNEKLTFIRKKGRLLMDSNRGREESDKSFEAEDNTTVKRIKTRTEKIYLDKIADTEIYTSWKEQKLIFKDETFESLAEKLERWYDVEIIIKGEKLSKYRFTGTFEKETVEQAIKALQLTTSFTYHLEQNEITIEPK